MLLRLLSCAVTPPPPNTSTITPPAYVMTQSGAIRRGRQPWQLGQPARSVAHPSPSPAVSRQPSAVSLQPSSRQPPASSIQPLTRATRSHRQALRTVQPTSHPSGDNQAITDRAALRPMADPARASAPKHPPAATLKVINTYVDNLLITC